MATQPYNPKDALKALLNAGERTQFDDYKKAMTAAETQLSKRECKGADTSFARAALYELDYWVSSTAEVAAAKDAFARFQAALACPDPPSALTQDAEGSFGPGTKLWFLKLDRSTDQILARAWPWPRQPIFLSCINDPVRMVTYLEDLSWSDIARCRRDNRKELNLAISVIARLVMKGGQAGYLSGPGFVPAFERFVRDWQDPETGFFGMTYVIDGSGNQVRSRDLSLTFHMARYVPHLVRWWPRLIGTLFAIRDGIYPQGWRDWHDGDKTMTDHNNYDIAELFHRGWRRMSPRQRQAASAALGEMEKWCLGDGSASPGSVKPDGSVVMPDKSDPIPDSYYYAAAFLDTIGYFERKKRFWTADAPPGDPAAIKAGMIARLKNFNPYYTEVGDTLFRLGATEHPWTNAIL